VPYQGTALAPHEEYIRKHLNIVRGKLREQRKKQT
jgi:hypothetical protein